MPAWQIVCEYFHPSSYNIGYCKRCGFHESDHDVVKSRG